jgi:HEPN domain-containing protein
MARYSTRESPRFPDDPRKFFRVATQRFDEAQFLYEGDRYAASIYIAGYSVECGLKALILSTEPDSGRKLLADSFRGSGWHNIHRLIEVYIDRKGTRPPPEIAKALTYVSDEWSVDLRYLAGERPFRDARQFIKSTELILGWIKGRL